MLVDLLRIRYLLDYQGTVGTTGLGKVEHHVNDESIVVACGELWHQFAVSSGFVQHSCSSNKSVDESSVDH